MSTELDQVTDARPDVGPPPGDARDAARKQLRMAVASELGTTGRASAPIAPVRASRRLLHRLGPALAVAVSAAVVLGVGALVLLAHPRGHRSAPAGHSAAAIRGAILDQSGDDLAVSRPVVRVMINLAQLPGSGKLRADVFRHLAQILGTSTKVTPCPVPGHGIQRLASIQCAVARGQAGHGKASVTVAAGVSLRVGDQIAHSNQLTGVETKSVDERTYPRADLAAQVIGAVGPIAPATNPRASAPGVVGRSGLESEYNRFLEAGENLRTSLDRRLQQAGQRALQHSMSATGGTGGAFVAMNPENGDVYAMGSLPTYDPSLISGTTTPTTYKQLTSPGSGDPLLNRAIQSAGPVGSTFKPMTATAALASGLWSVDGVFDDTGQFCVGSGAAEQCRHNSGHAVDGPLNLVQAMRVSSDDFFYNLGARTNADPTTHPNGGALGAWASQYGIGRLTGIDLPDETGGTLPTPAWRASRNKLESECDGATGPYRGKPKHAPGGCGIADGSDRPWSIGDNESLAVGQGDLQVTPLQLAVAYAALANGGTIVRPHLGLDIQAGDGTVLQAINPPPSRHLTIDPAYRQTILNGLHQAAQSPGGTSDDVMGNFPQTVYGKTGSAQYTDQPDHAWYACFVPASATTKPIVVIVDVERGGFGDVAAAPVARAILSQWFFGNPGKYRAGTSATL
jgi:penicillin-binding protein 2